MTERRPTYGKPDPPPKPMTWLSCPCDVGGHQCGQNLLGLLDPDKQQCRVICTFCRQAVIVTVKRETLPVIVSAMACPERGVGE